jgi:SEC-C motif-containing protein
MRSRYTAFVRGEIDYILDTAAPELEVDRTDTEKWSRDSAWLGLRIIDTERGGPEDDDGKVEFVATFSQGGQEQIHHELATFRREEGRWLFVDGETPKGQPSQRSGPKIGRNEPCPCGSGKKYKKCCAA